MEKLMGAQRRLDRIGRLLAAGLTVDEITTQLQGDLGKDNPARREVVVSAVSALTPTAEGVPA